MNNNIKSSIPEIFYIFINKYNPVAIHNLRIVKTFTSAAYTYCLMDTQFIQKYLDGTAKYLPFSPCENDLKVISPYCMTSINDYRIEYDAEMARYHYFSKYPSRLSAIFAFSDIKSCEYVSNKYKWDLSTVKKFKLSLDELTRAIKVNMEIVSLARLAYKISMISNDTINNIWKSYWNSSGNIEMELPNVEGGRQIHNSGEI